MNYICIIGLCSSHTCHASLSLWPSGASLRWAALTEVEVTLVVVQGVVLVANARRPGVLGQVLREDVTREGGPLRGGLRVGRHRIRARHDLQSLWHAGGHLGDGFLGVLVLGLLGRLSFSMRHHSEDEHHDHRQKGGETAEGPHGGLESESR